MSVARFIADQRTFCLVPHTFSCRVLSVSEAWFYKWRDRPPTPRQTRRALLDEAVRKAFAGSKASYGSPRVHADLIDPALPHPELTASALADDEEPFVLVACQEPGTDRPDAPVEEPVEELSGSSADSDALPGRACAAPATPAPTWQVSVNTVADSMRRQGLAGRKVKRNRGLTRQDRTAPKFPDLLKRDFTAKAANQRWVGDMTEIPTDEGKLYLASVIDLCSRRLLAAPTSEHPNAQLACDAIRMATAVRGGAEVIAGVIFHTDRGSTYTAGDFTT